MEQKGQKKMGSRMGCILLMGICCLLLTGCIQTVKVEIVLGSSSTKASKAIAPAPTATATPESTAKPEIITPLKFQNTETLPPETSQVIN